MSLSAMGAARKCKAAYEKAIELDGANISARLSLLQFYLQAPGVLGGGTDKAHVQADEVMKLDLARGRVAKAGVFAAEKNFAAAVALYDANLKDNPDDYGSLYAVGRIAALSGQHLDQGMAALDKCLRMTPLGDAPGHAAAHWRRGNIFEKKGDVSAARSAHEAALAIDAKFESALASLKKLN